MHTVVLGDAVVVAPPREALTGTVGAMYACFDLTPEPVSMTRAEWLAEQCIPPTELEKPWCRVHVENAGGVVLVPMNALRAAS